MMLKTATKWFWVWEHEKEEEWLNAMSQQGWQLKSVGFARYTFESGSPGKYSYRLEFLEHFPHSAKGQDYLGFLSETGIEHVASYSRWVYLRKEGAAEAFELFSDDESLLKHISRLLTMIMPLLVLNLFFASSHLIQWASGHYYPFFPFVIQSGVSLLLLFGAIKLWLKVKAIKK